MSNFADIVTVTFSSGNNQRCAPNLQPHWNRNRWYKVGGEEKITKLASKFKITGFMRITVGKLASIQ